MANPEHNDHGPNLIPIDDDIVIDGLIQPGAREEAAQDSLTEETNTGSHMTSLEDVLWQLEEEYRQRQLRNQRERFDQEFRP